MPTKFPCICCSKPCKKNQNCIFCDLCEKWTHLKCTKLKYHEFMSLGSSDQPFYCSGCYQTIFPFNAITNDELIDCLSNDIEDITCNKPDLTKIDRNELDYWCLDDAKTELKANKELYVLHVNIRSITKNLSALEDLIVDLEREPDIIAITETKLQKT